MTFLREQMGEEELRHLLEMLSVEAGASAGQRQQQQRGRRGRRRRCELKCRALRVSSRHLLPVAMHPTAACSLHSPAGKDGGIDVNRLMELADEAEDEEENGPHSEQQ